MLYVGVDLLANYVGVHCPVCDKRFVDDDDIVVCPICGAPHHRTCYQKLGHCALNDLHISGHTWKPAENEPHGEDSAAGPQAESSAESAACPACGAANPRSGIFCRICGAPLARRSGETPGVNTNAVNSAAFGGFGGFSAGQAPAGSAYTAAFGGLSPDEQIDGVSARDIALFVGENSQYFLPRFKQLSQSKGLSPNFAAFFFNFLYFFYRKMYFYGSILLGVFVVCQIPSFFIAPEYAKFMMENMQDMVMGISVPFTPTQNLWAYTAVYYMRYIMIGFGLVFSLYANRFYMRHVLNKIRTLRAGFIDEAGKLDDTLYTQALSTRGRTSRAAVVICVISLTVIIFAICGIITAAIVPAV